MPLISFLNLIRQIRTRLPSMSRRSLSPSEARSPSSKRRKLDFPPLAPDDYKNGVMLAPMVRSGAREYSCARARNKPNIDVLVPTRLFALKHGAKLVWGPEVVDKAILHAERVVDGTSCFACADYIY